jgi:hypothetical protein
MEHYDKTLDLVSAFLDEQEFRYHVCADRPAIEMRITGEHAVFPILIVVFGEEPKRGLGVCVRIPIVVPEKQRVQMAEAITRANYDLNYGCFELDMSDGELDFRTEMPIYDGEVTQRQVSFLVRRAWATADDYTRAFLRLLYAEDLSPAEVIAEVEMD